MDGNKIILAAHRGDQYLYPENTIESFCSAIDCGVDMIETDVRMTLDGELVLLHDRSCLRTTGVDRNVDEMTLEELKKLNAGKYFSDKMHAEIPTVKEFLNLIMDEKILINWEIKVYPNSFGERCAFEVVDKLIHLIEEYGVEQRSMMNSFSIRNLEYIYKKHGKKFPIHGQGIYKCSRSNDNCETSEIELFDWCCLYPNIRKQKVLDYPENFHYCVKNNILPCVCIPDHKEDYQRAIEYGCRMFTSNNIHIASEILNELR